MNRTCKVYIAAKFEDRGRINSSVVPILNASVTTIGETIELTSSWLDIPLDVLDGIEGKRDITEVISNAVMNMQGIEDCDVFILETAPVSPGKYFEFGYAMRANKRIVLIGPVWHVFHSLHRLRKFDSWADFYKAIEERRFSFTSQLDLKGMLPSEVSI